MSASNNGAYNLVINPQASAYLTRQATLSETITSNLKRISEETLKAWSEFATCYGKFRAYPSRRTDLIRSLRDARLQSLVLTDRIVDAFVTGTMQESAREEVVADFFRWAAGDSSKPSSQGILVHISNLNIPWHLLATDPRNPNSLSDDELLQAPDVLGARRLIHYMLAPSSSKSSHPTSVGFDETKESWDKHLVAVGATVQSETPPMQPLEVSSRIESEILQAVPSSQIRKVFRKISIQSILKERSDLDCLIFVAHGTSALPGSRIDRLEMGVSDALTANDLIAIADTHLDETAFRNAPAVILLSCGAGGDGVKGSYAEHSLPGAFLRLGSSMVLASMTSVSLGASLEMLNRMLPHAVPENGTLFRSFAQTKEEWHAEPTRNEDATLKALHDNFFAPFSFRMVVEKTFNGSGLRARKPSLSRSS